MNYYNADVTVEVYAVQCQVLILKLIIYSFIFQFLLDRVTCLFLFARILDFCHHETQLVEKR